ncbi:HalOD1 output domain-containing protein [Haladaptatus sp. CMAA 1911]|uniref:HalOD1 output domain-containing protein n=1 Tax=unclassified Haladaptatus TaxID=2622732 RepID=UPI0037546C33
MHDSPPSKAEPSIRVESETTESLTATVVRAVTEAKDRKPATPLYEAINPDALEDLYRRGSPEIRFEYVGYSVTIHSDRSVTVSELGA